MPEVSRVVSTPSLVSRNMPTAMMAPPSTGNSLYRPVPVVIWPDRMEVIVTPIIIGGRISPPARRDGAPARPREQLVPAGPGGDLARQDGGDRHPDHHRGQHQPAG